MKISTAYEVLDLTVYTGFDGLMDARTRVALLAAVTDDPQLIFRANEAAVTILVSEDWMTPALGIVCIAELNGVNQEVERPNASQQAVIRKIRSTF